MSKQCTITIGDIVHKLKFGGQVVIDVADELASLEPNIDGVYELPPERRLLLEGVQKMIGEVFITFDDASK